MTQQLFIIDSLHCAKTSSFWRKHQESFCQALPEAEMIFIDSLSLKELALSPNLERVLIVGTDSGCSRIINLTYPHLSQKGVLVTFLPSETPSALAEGLNYRAVGKSLIPLLHCKNHIMMSLIRCHCIDASGGPQNWLALNDILLRLPQPKLPSLLKGLMSRILYATGLNEPKSLSQISLLADHKVVYDGPYLFSMVLLGSHMTHGPQLREIQRGFQHKFGYFQLNQTQALKTKSFKQLIQEGDKEILYANQFAHLELRAIGEEHSLIADGVEIGHLPASLTLLPRALKVTSPLVATAIKSGFNGRLSEAELSSAPRTRSANRQKAPKET